MKTFVIGTADEVGAFSLVGVPGHACATAEDVQQAVQGLNARTDVALVLVSEPIANLAPEAIASLQHEQGPPAVVVLP